MLAGIKLMRMIRKDQMIIMEGVNHIFFEQFYELANEFTSSSSRAWKSIPKFGSAWLMQQNRTIRQLLIQTTWTPTHEDFSG